MATAYATSMAVLGSRLPTTTTTSKRSALPYQPLRPSTSATSFPTNIKHFTGKVKCQSPYWTSISPFLKCGTSISTSRKLYTLIPRSSSSSGGPDDSKASDKAKVPFGYSRKDVLLIGVGVTVLGIGLKSGLEFVGVDPLQAGNVVQLVLVLGLTIGWISTYIFRVSNKEMTYAQQLRDYESKVMEKRLEGLTEAELEVLLEQVEEERQSLASEQRRAVSATDDGISSNGFMVIHVAAVWKLELHPRVSI